MDPDLLRGDLLERRLPACRRLARRLFLLEEAASTSDEARQRAAEAGNAADGILVAAERQTAGRGRRSRDWWSGPPGANLAVTLVFAPPPEPVEALGVLAACALAAALRPWTRATVAVKWPNDLLLGGAKAGGLLAELPSLGPGRAPAALLGLGLNVHAAPPPGLPRPTTCLAEHAWRRPVRTALLVAWLMALERRLGRLATAGPDEAEQEFLQLLRAWAPHGVRGGPGDPQGPLLEFALSEGLTWGGKAAQTTRPLGLVPALHPLPDPATRPRQGS